MIRVIGLGEYIVSNNTEDSIKTFALASCVGLVMYNKKEKKLGMVHIVLPEVAESESAPTKRAGYYAQTAVPILLDEVFGGHLPEKKDYKISLYGGAISRNEKDIFCIGERNVSQIEKILISKGYTFDRKNTGGRCSRTIEAFVCNGNVLVRTQKMR